MPERRRGSGGSRQPDLFARSKQPKISLPDNHPMVVLTETVDWTEMEVRAEKIDLYDVTFAVQAAEQIAALFGKAPRSYAYDRAGHSARNVDRPREIGVRDV